MKRIPVGRKAGIRGLCTIKRVETEQTNVRVKCRTVDVQMSLRQNVQLIRFEDFIEIHHIHVLQETRDPVWPKSKST